MAVRAQRQTKGLAAGRNGSGDLPGCQVDADQAEIAAVQYQQFVGAGVVQEIRRKAVFIIDAVDDTVQGNRVRHPELVQIVSNDGAVVAAAEIDGLRVR